MQIQTQINNFYECSIIKTTLRGLCSLDGRVHSVVKMTAFYWHIGSKNDSIMIYKTTPNVCTYIKQLYTHIVVWSLL